MKKQGFNNIRLGAFVLAGLLFLVLLLYMIGKNEHLFGDTYVLKAKFDNIQGLIAGNNVRYAGIETGTVKEINILNDTTIEITMVIEKKMRHIIRKNAVVTVGTEGFVGNKVVNINPARQPAPLSATAKANDMAGSFQSIAADIKNGKGSVGQILKDTALADNLNEAISQIKSVGVQADSLIDEMNNLVTGIREDKDNGKGTVHAIFKDSAIVVKINATLDNIQKGTDGFNQNMEAMKHNFLFKGYFKDLEKQKQKQAKAKADAEAPSKAKQ
jgi:phospholipid/cholesterol/gamma-HCH transport system substrate-binding protein